MDTRAKLRLAAQCARYQATRRPTPIAMAWLITGRCNLRCAYCMWTQLREGPELDTAQVLDMLEQQHRAGVTLVSFTGGEPLLRADIGVILRHAKRLGMVTKLNTNGLLVSERLADLRSLDLLQVSFDGPPAVHDTLRGEGSGAAARDALLLARDVGIPIQAITCLSRGNVARLGEVLDQALADDIALTFQLLDLATVAGDDRVRAEADREALIVALKRLQTWRRDASDPRSRAIASSPGSLRALLQRVQHPSERCSCAPISATMLPDGQLIVCGNARTREPIDAVGLGFAEAFSRLQVPECEGCVCVGRLRVTRAMHGDLSVIRELIEL
ncbi:MAG: radical SAM protein [Pseudomonadota bacterium]